MSENGHDEKIMVWDFPTRAFHWLLVLSFTVAYVSSGSETYFPIHAIAGFSVLGLMIFRLVWGLAGNRYARFSALHLSPSSALRYLNRLVGGDPEHHVGHNPAGSLAVILMIVLGLGTTLLGLALYLEAGGEELGDIHQVFGNAMLALVLIHVSAVVISSLLHKENLPRAMVTGIKRGRPADAARAGSRLLAAVLVLLVAGTWGAYAAGKLDIKTPQIMQEHHDGHDHGETGHADGDHDD